MIFWPSSSHEPFALTQKCDSPAHYTPIICNTMLMSLNQNRGRDAYAPFFYKHKDLTHAWKKKSTNPRNQVKEWYHLWIYLCKGMEWYISFEKKSGDIN